MNRKVFFLRQLALVSIIFFSSLSITKAQVTIGSGIEPIRGSILDLKEFNNDQGLQTSEKGLVLPRVFLTDLDNLYPMLTGTEPNYSTLKLEHTGTIVYNVNNNLPLKKGLHVWNGANWIFMVDNSSINVGNGLSLSNNTIKWGGSLTEQTSINLNNNNLLFSSNTGKIGINTTTPTGNLHVLGDNTDPIVAGNMKFVNDAANPSDVATSPQYYNVVASEAGALRKVPPIVTDLNQSFLYDLNMNTAIAIGDNLGNNGSLLSWDRNGQSYDYIELPEDGAYIFSFRLYGNLSGSANANSFYVSLLKNGSTAASLFDVAEITVVRNGYDRATYSINMTVAGKAGDKIYSKIAQLSGRSLSWSLNASSPKSANKTSMIYWKL